MREDKPKLLIADKKGRVYDLSRFEATGMKAGEPFRLKPRDLVRLHPDSELFVLPGRRPVGYDFEKSAFIRLDKNPFIKKEKAVYAVAAFLPPGKTATYSASYTECGRVKTLPLFSYAAVAFYKNGFYAASVRVDREKRQELKGMDLNSLEKNVKLFKKLFPKNRLIRHLEKCALTYACPAAKNFFLKRYEGPLPTSPVCNARCIGCISYQPGKTCSVTQPRIRFIPSAEEVAEVALMHIRAVKDPVVSFGQGCEGEPLMTADILEKAIKLIRKTTSKGIINLNTNASKPGAVRRLFDAGLDSMRVSINSVREKYYTAYYMPQGYGFGDVIRSIELAKKAGGFVSINYLVMPGFSDSRAEAEEFVRFLKKTKTDMVQWRNLNYDPMAYFRKLRVKVSPSDMIGVKELIREVKEKLPHIMHGYFNPSRMRMRRMMKRG